MSIDALYTARWHLLNNLPVPKGGPLEALLDDLRPTLGPEPVSQPIEQHPPETEPPVQEIPAIEDNSAHRYRVQPIFTNLVDGKLPIVGRRFTRGEFLDYLYTVGAPAKWRPVGVTMHGTSSPSLAQRPDGFTEQHMLNLRDFYLGQGWLHGPHLFVDDHGIWVFSPLSERGTHSQSFNNTRFGIEMLGEYDRAEDPWSGRGLKVIENGQFAAAAILKLFALGYQRMNFHRHDSATNHRTCPGNKIDFVRFEAGMIQFFNAIPTP